MRSFQHLLCATFAILVLGTSIHVHAAVFCTKTESDLSTALGQAASNSQDNTIKIVAGTIIPSFALSYSMTNAFNLDIEGGWSNDCTTQKPNAALTILDGTSATGGLSLVTYASGNITLRYLTIQNYHGAFDTLLMEAFQTGTATGDLRVENCLFLNNAPADTADVIGISNDTASSGAVYFLDNAVIGNVVSGSRVIVRLEGASTADPCSICANNNTVSGNTLASGSLGAVYLTPHSIHTNLANNILWNNAGTDLYAISGFHPVLVDNDIGTEGGTTPSAGSSGNISVDPLFMNAAADNYRLRATSPARDAGDNTPPGTIRNYDLDGLARIDVTTVDMGAYEFHDVIFANDFE